MKRVLITLLLGVALVAPTYANASIKTEVQNEWKSLSPGWRKAHCQAYNAHPRQYRRGFIFGVKLAGVPKRKRVKYWRVWRSILHKKCYILV